MQQFLETENARANAAFATTTRAGRLRDRIHGELTLLAARDDVSVPRRRGAYEYFVRQDAGAAHPVYLRGGGSGPSTRRRAETIGKSWCSTATPWPNAGAR